jgi:hypothetical protein
VDLAAYQHRAPQPNRWGRAVALVHGLRVLSADDTPVLAEFGPNNAAWLALGLQQNGAQ